LLFVGAGCSKAVGSKDLQELTIKAKDALKKEGYADLLKAIEVRLESANRNYQFFNQGEIDLEVILSILNANTAHFASRRKIS
jgi:hypothetical protein